MRIARTLFWVTLALTAAACGGGTVDRLGPLEVGGSFPSGAAPPIEGKRIVGWNCRGRTMAGSREARPLDCIGLADLTAIYRDSRWQYNVEVRGGRVENIKRSYSDFWP